MANTELSKEEVKNRLESYESDGVTEELYQFGTMLLHDAVDRLAKINNTAAVTAAYCAGLITILTSTATVWSKEIGRWERILPIGSAVLAGLAAALAISSMSLKSMYWFSQDDWINRDCLGDYRRIKKFHILTMWTVIDSFDAAYRTKTARVKRSHYLTVIAVALLFLTLLEITWRLGAV